MPMFGNLMESLAEHTGATLPNSYYFQKGFLTALTLVATISIVAFVIWSLL